MKLIEIDFTNSGTLQTDLVGNLNINLSAGSVSNVKPLLGFNVRPGKFINGDSGGAQSLPTTSGILNFYDTTHTQKTMVLWYHTLSGAQNNGGLWVQTSAPTNDHGWQVDTSAESIYFRMNGVSTYPASPSGVLNTPNWKCSAVTIDRVASGVNIYFNGLPITAITGTIPTSPATNSTLLSSDRFGLDVPALYGCLEVYDEILTPIQLLNLYNASIPDTIKNRPLVSITGTVLDPMLLPISGANVVAYNHLLNETHSIYKTTSGGHYVAHMPLLGHYTLFSTTSGLNGGRAINALVSGINSVVFYDS